MNELYPTLGICSNLALFRALVLDKSPTIFIFLSTVILPLPVLKGYLRNEGVKKRPPLPSLDGSVLLPRWPGPALNVP